MVIKEVEEQTGMTRANIRFYEKEGLLTPQRAENGYRDYSEADLKELEKIKLLRVLGLPLEDIRAAQSGQKELNDLMKKHMSTLEEERKKLETAQEVCREMQRDGSGYDELNAQSYLKELEPETVPSSDSMDFARLEFWRLIARYLDGMLYEIIIVLMVRFGLHCDPLEPAFLHGWFVLNFFWLLLLNLLQLLLEPIMLHLWGFTPGKWLLGMKVTAPDGGKVSYPVALRRTWKVLVFGQGLNLPVIELYRLWKSNRDLENGRQLPWERESVLYQETRKEKQPKLFFRMLFVGILVYMVMMFLKIVPIDKIFA